MIPATKTLLHPPILAVCIIAISVFLVLPAQSAPRKFTNSAGKVIEAELVGASETTATLKMGNGKEITAKSSLFSKEDQTYITEWLKKNPAQLKYRFDVDQSRKRLGKTKYRSGHVEVTREEWVYKVSVKNLCKDGQKNADVKDLKVAYKIYKSGKADARLSSSSGKSASVEGKYFVTNGSKTLDNLPYLKNGEIQTASVFISTSQLDPNYYYPNGNKDKLKDKLEGIWIKLYHGGREVGEFKSGGSAVKTAIWK